VKFCKCVNGNGELLLVGAEDKKISVYQIREDLQNTDPPIVVAEMVGHANRVKALETLTIALPKSLNSKRISTTVICSISSDGKIFLYDLASLPSPSPSSSKFEITPKAEYDTKGTRLTCITLAEEGEAVTESENGKRKLTDTDEAADSDEEDMEAEDEQGWSIGDQASAFEEEE
jgi:protein MAK11